MPKGRDLQIYRAHSFKGGLDVKTSPLALSMRKVQDRLTQADNMVYTTSGAVTKRYDQATYTTASLGATVAITGGHQLRRSNGNDYNVCGTDDGRLVLLNTDGTTTNLTTGLTTGARWSFAAYGDVLISCYGGAPRSFDGTTDGALGGSPPDTGQKVAVHGNRVFMLDLTQRSRVSFSALNNQADWTTANDAGSIQVAQNDGSNCIDLIPSINELIILKNKRPYRLQGTNPTAGFTIANVLPTTGSIGGVSFQGGLFALNDVWWVSTSGVHNLETTQNFGDLHEAFVSDQIDPYFTPNTDYTVSLNNLNLAVSVYDAQNNRLYWGVDTDNDGDNDTLLVYDGFDQSWSVWSGMSCASLWIARTSSNGQEEVFMGGYDGHVRVLNRNVSTNAIDGTVKHISNLNAPGVEKSPRHAFLYFTEEGNYTVTVTTNFDFGATGGQSYAVSQLGSSRTLGVNWTLGTDPLGARTLLVKRQDLSGIGEYLELGVRNAVAGQPFTWQGYEILWRPRRVVRRGG